MCGGFGGWLTLAVARVLNSDLSSVMAPICALAHIAKILRLWPTLKTTLYPCACRTIRPSVEMKNNGATDWGIILFMDAASLFANLRIGNTEPYVFLLAGSTYQGQK
jgi:hypothetical protein